ncbi:hypothetical protein AYO49_03550 [Verrucomicrobiaceae bacterium SCGC AG-212-N21]|nr:hypothetical protein AYO49_03550 [Verrucomicrobiaceae bacterium SCGC AG-212-N21]
MQKLFFKHKLWLILGLVVVALVSITAKLVLFRSDKQSKTITADGGGNPLQPFPGPKDTGPPGVPATSTDSIPGKTTATPARKTIRWVFATPLIVTSDKPESPEAVLALDQLIARYQTLGGQENLETAGAIEAYLVRFPLSPYAVSLWQEKAAIEWRHGSFTDSLASHKAAWEAGKDKKDIDEKRLAETGLSELLLNLSRMGKTAELRKYVESLATRALGGTAQEAMLRAKETLWFLENKAEQNVFCGFTAANNVCVPHGKKPIFPDVHSEEEMRIFIANGLSLFELRAHSHESDGDLRILKRTAPASDLPVPSIIHWKFDHYSAITERSGDKYRVKDEHLKYDAWVTAETLQRDTTGYVLASAATLIPTGYTEISDEEAKSVFGRHCTHARDDEGDDPPTDDCGGDQPMARHRFRLMNPGLEIVDTPTSYRPAYGPDVSFKLEFDQRSTVIPDLQQHGNFGPRWTYDHLGYVNLVGTGTPSSSVRVVFGNGNYYSYSYSTANGTYTPKDPSRPHLHYMAAGAGGPGFRLLYKDGQEWQYTQPNSATPTRYHLTAIKDPHGNTKTFAYDASLRLISISDALSQVTSISYAPEAGDEVASDTKKIRRITDPFGRSSRFKYTSAGQLRQIIDPVGIVSEFGYAAGGDFVNSLTTPYGTTSFSWGELPGINEEPGRFIEATDPYGDKERVEANDFANYPANGDDPNPAPSSVMVAGQAVPFYPKNDNLFYRNTFHWDKLQTKYYPGDYSKATIYNWKAENSVITGVLSSMVKPLEGRVWFNYPGQTNADALGTHPVPSKTVRAVEKPDGTPAWSMTQQEFDPLFGKVRRTVDQLGRETLYEYNDDGNVPGAVKGMDLTAMKVKQAGAFVAVARFSNFINHMPQTVTDAAGQVTQYQYHGTGQIAAITNAKNETTTFTYYAADAAGKQRKGRLWQVNGALPGDSDVVTFDYDSAGNTAQVTGPDGYYLRFAYDAIARITRVTFPDESYSETTYSRLDPLTSRDRLGRITNYVYNKLGQLESVTDPANRTLRYNWCKCGDLRQLIDAMGRTTTWRHDAGGRVTAKEYADGSKIVYGYEPFSGRLRSITDEKGQVKTNLYNLDDTLAGITYANEQHETPDVAFTYEADIRRLASMVDGVGTTTYVYNPLASAMLGAGKLVSLDGPLSDDTLTYSYDELGRRISYAINGVGETRAFDALGRLITVTNPLGIFGYTYAGATGRMSTVTYPNGMTCQYNYHPVTGDFRLKDIIHTISEGTLLYRHNYEYNAVGNITRWTQSAPQTGLNRSWLCGYDAANQLTSVTSQDPNTLVAQATGQYAYSYDQAGNRLTETIDSVTSRGTYNSLNQLTGIAKEGVSSAESDQIYEWDGEDRLSAITYPETNARTEFKYDGYGRRVSIVEKRANVVEESRSFIWEGTKLVETRDAASNSIQMRNFSRGIQSSATGTSSIWMFAKDQLGSVRAAVEIGGVSKIIDFDPWGRRSTDGNQEEELNLGFTGHWLHEPSGMTMAPFRTFNSDTGRWLSRDPIEEGAGTNLYAYVSNSPLNDFDSLGLCGMWDDPYYWAYQGLYIACELNIFCSPYAEITDLYDERFVSEEARTLGFYMGFLKPLRAKAFVGNNPFNPKLGRYRNKKTGRFTKGDDVRKAERESLGNPPRGPKDRGEDNRGDCGCPPDRKPAPPMQYPDYGYPFGTA